MDDCIPCAIAAKRIKVDPIYEDESVIAVLDTKGNNLGQMLIFPRRHVPILEQLPPAEWKRMGVLGNALSVALFEAISPKGTNVFVANGLAAGQTIPHVLMHIIPRAEKDDIVLNWSGKTLTDQQLSSIELKIKDSLEEKVVQEPQAQLMRSLPTDEVSLIQKQLYHRP